MRKNCPAGEIVDFQFDNPVIAYRIKNFTEGAIYHTYKSDFVLSETSKVASNFGEDTKINEFINQSAFLNVKVKADVTGEVEVQPIKF